jgi:hypothetical protein
MGLKLPPAFVNTPAYDVFNMDLSDSVYRTLAVLHGLAWQTRGERTPPTTVAELAALRGLRERQMYTHLRTLKKLRRIRVDKLGHGLMVIYPLRWESGAALPTAVPSTLTEVEPTQLTGEDEPASEITAINCSKNDDDEPGWDDPRPPPGHDRPMIAKNCNTTAINCSKTLNTGPDLDDPEPQPGSGQEATAINCSKSGPNGEATAINCSKNDPDEPDLDDSEPETTSGPGLERQFTAKNCSNHVVVVDSCLKDSDYYLKQQHEQHATAINCSKNDPDEPDLDGSDLETASRPGSDRQSTAINCSENSDLGPGLDDSGPEPRSQAGADQEFTAINCSKNDGEPGMGNSGSASGLESGSQSGVEPEFTAINCSKNDRDELGLDDSGLETASRPGSGQQFTAKNCSKLIKAIAAIFVEAGDSPDLGRAKAVKLIRQHGVDCCERQLSYFPRRCELARASEEGLRNPSGLFIRSVQDDWTAPPQTDKKSSSTWYTQEEFDDLIEH